MIKRKTTALPVALGVALCVGLGSAGTANANGAPVPELANAGAGADDAEARGGAEGSGADGASPHGSGTASASIVRNGAPLAFDSLESAVAAARDGEQIVLSGDFSISAPLRIADGRSIALRASSPVSIRRGAGFPTSGGKPQGLVKLAGSSSLSMSADDGAELVLDGERTDSDEAVVTVDGSSSFTMGAGAVVENAQASWKPWAGVYVRSGSFLLDGGQIRDGLAMRNAAVAVERGSSFEMRAGAITGNRSTYSEAIVWSKGSITMSGGSIASNAANSGASRDGVVYVLGGGSLSFVGGTIGDNATASSCGIKVDGGSLAMGDAARMSGSDRIGLKGSSTIAFASALSAHTAASPLPITLLDSWDSGRVVATFPSPGEARDALRYLSVKTGEQTPEIVTLSVDDGDGCALSVAGGDLAHLIDLTDNPYADDLGLTFKDEFLGVGAFDRIRDELDAAYGGVESPERQERFARIDDLERQMAYLEAHRGEIEDSVLTLSQLGDPVADRDRTKQNFMFDNLDATGYYLKPGQVNEFLLYVEADDPSALSLAWRQVGLTENNQFSALNLFQRTGLRRGVNRVVVDLTDKRYGYMLYMRNDSVSNGARVRLEAVDANEPGAEPVVGTQLGAHPYYLHDASDPSSFWDYVQEIRAYAEQVSSGRAEDMTLLQMGDEGRAQFSIRASALASAYRDINSEEDAVDYIRASNDAIQERLEFFWAFDGFDAEGDGPNAVSRMRVHTAFTKTVTYPSSMYATGRYFHMPEGSAAGFLAGASMYGWGMSHEYGHVLDNSVTVVNEETNNMYSIAGARNGEIIASAREGRSFDASSAYHQNALRAARLWDEELARMAQDPTYAPDWNEGGWGHYIWAHLSAWWNGTHFFDGWDYSSYDYESSPFTPQGAQEVARYGAFGATMRILRGDAEAVAEIERLTASIQDGTSRKYNRIALAYTMGTGYDFAEYLETMGQRDLSDQVREFCARYPSMPRKVHYYSLHADAAELDGAVAYEGDVAPLVTVSSVDGSTRIEAEMPTGDLARSTCAYELYIDGELAGFSRTGSFELEGAVDRDSVSVVSYDVRLNPSRAASASDIPFGVSFPQMTVGEKAGPISIDGPQGATYSFSVEDESVLAIDAEGNLTAKAAGTTGVLVTMHRAGKPDSGPHRFSATVDARRITIGVADASMHTGSSLPHPDLTIVSGSLLDGDELGDATFSARTEDGGAADLSVPGSYLIEADLAGLGPDYDVAIEPGELEVVQDEARSSWVALLDADGDEIAAGAWTNGAVTIAPTGEMTAAGVYDLIREEGGGGFAHEVVVDEEGETARGVRLGVGDGASAGAFSSELAVTTRIDTTAPTVELSIAEDRTATGPLTVAATAHDDPSEEANASSGVERIELTLVDAQTGEIADEVADEDARAQLEVARAGAYRLVAIAFDRAGNASPEAEISFEVAGEDGKPGPGTDGGDEGAPGDPAVDGDAPGGDGDPTVDGDASADDEPAPSPDDGAGAGDQESEEADPGDGSEDASTGEAQAGLVQTFDASATGALAAVAGSAAAFALSFWTRRRTRP